MWRLDEVLKAVNGTAYRTQRDVFTNVSTDSRTIRQGDLFIPITGPNFDGHKFIGEAYEKTHAGAFCEKSRLDTCRNAPGTIILVEDTTQALLDLARYTRERLSSTCIAITGSNGKTTTKEILVHMLRKSFSVHFNEKNFNNLIGVSQSVLAIDKEPEICVFELGTNSPGEIRKLAVMSQPDMSIITNVNPSHLEGLGSMEGVLREKLDLFHLTREGGKIFVNADDPYIMQASKDIRNRVSITYGMTDDAMFHLRVQEDLGWDGSRVVIAFGKDKIDARTSLIGKHNLYNVLAAASIAYTAGVEKTRITEAIETFNSFDKRLKPSVTGRGFAVIDDTYNANPASMEWALKTLLELPSSGKRIAILGDMRELGNRSTDYHRELGKFISSINLPVVALIGEEMEEAYRMLGADKARFFKSKAPLIDYILAIAKKGDTVLVKGSRILKMEEIVEALT
ncbi:MAG TPA: UDP-N-acetylmuramoyl-tripeptide--D-alanyl-D-alanine ligase [Syntrophorhabdaceae bacterium]|nr:UDP-N-acetylmuramoyl-tripeptide--D-alanyl-D-alanine ligase [Syntrophorhabdaceae bacterium]